MSYRPSARPPKGRWAQFLHTQRRERDWSQAQAFEVLREGLRLGPRSRYSYTTLDMGDRQPKPHEEAFLVEYFGQHPPPDVLPSGGEAEGSLAAVIERHTEAIREQTEMLRQVLSLLGARALPPLTDDQRAFLRAAGAVEENEPPRTLPVGRSADADTDEPSRPRRIPAGTTTP